MAPQLVIAQAKRDAVFFFHCKHQELDIYAKYLTQESVFDCIITSFHQGTNIDIHSIFGCTLICAACLCDALNLK